MNAQLDSDSQAISRTLGRVGSFLLALAPYLIGAACIGFALVFVASSIF